jgi:lipopolysaccharide export system protein LptC
MLRSTLSLTLLLCIAGATWYLRSPGAPEVADSVARDSGPLGYYLRGARLLGTDDSGRIAYTVSADSAEELPLQGALELRGVAIAYAPENDVPWEVKATRATAPKAGDHLDLTGSVELRSKPTDGSAPIVIVTDHLRFTPDRFSAESADPVEVRLGESAISAVGLKADLKDDSVELESEVHGRFAR